MILFGLTGGIGSGKSSVSALLGELGAVIVDGDLIARGLQRAGSPVLREINEAFPGVVNEVGELDRASLAGIVFESPEKLAKLNGIMLPKIQQEIDNRISELRHTDSVVVLDLPLLVEHPRNDLDGVIVVDLPVDIAIQRLVGMRGMNERDARARIDRQASREARRKIADVVIDNSGTPDDLRARVIEVWHWMKERSPKGNG